MALAADDPGNKYEAPMESVYNQKEGNGNINMGLFAQFSQEIVLTSEMIHHRRVEKRLALRNGA